VKAYLSTVPKGRESAKTRDHQYNPDPNDNAARIVAESTHDESRLPPT
jgi:hypothetical protein